MDGALPRPDPVLLWHPVSCLHHSPAASQALLRPVTALSRCAERLGPRPWGGERQPGAPRNGLGWPSPRHGASFCEAHSEPLCTVLFQKAVRVTTLMKRLRAPEQSAPGTDTAATGAAGGATAASGAAPAPGGSATMATVGDAAKSKNVAPADRSAIPATDGSATPATDGSVTPATDGSITPATDGSVTPATDRSVTPATDGRATPATEESTVPTTQSSATPATKAAAIPEPALAQPDSTAPGGATGQAPPSSKGEEAAGYAQESWRAQTS